MNIPKPKTYNLSPNHLKPKTYGLILLCLMVLFGLGFGSFALAAYETSGNFTSTNLLSGLNVESIDSFVYNLSALPSNTGATIQFSANNSTWFNSSGTQDGTNSLSTGSNNSISLSTLAWTTANFYYKVSFTTSDGVDTPVLDDITLNYTTYTSAASAPCSINNADGTCSVADAGDHATLAACKVCNGTDLTSENATNNTQDTVGNTCNSTCAACQTGSCSNATVDTDPGSDCSAVTCTDYIYGWSGNNCAKYSGSSDHNGDCNGSGACYTAVADSCTGIGSPSASCVSAGCKMACATSSVATSYDTVAEICYTSGAQACGSGECDDAGECHGACTGVDMDDCFSLVCSGVWDGCYYLEEVGAACYRGYYWEHFAEGDCWCTDGKSYMCCEHGDW